VIRPPELAGNLTGSHLLANQEEMGEGNDKFGLNEVSLFVLRRDI
jgi:hypothetical protein